MPSASLRIGGKMGIDNLREKIGEEISLLFKKYVCAYSQRDVDICIGKLLALIGEGK